jgi:hypothetical protein
MVRLSHTCSEGQAASEKKAIIGKDFTGSEHLTSGGFIG